MKELEKIIARTHCFMHQSFFRPNYIFDNDAYFLDFRAQKFPLIFFNVNPCNINKPRCKITALKGFLYTDGPFRAVSRTVQIFNNMGRQKSRQNFTFL